MGVKNKAVECWSYSRVCDVNVTSGIAKSRERTNNEKLDKFFIFIQMFIFGSLYNTEVASTINEGAAKIR